MPSLFFNTSDHKSLTLVDYAKCRDTLGGNPWPAEVLIESRKSAKKIETWWIVLKMYPVRAHGKCFENERKKNQPINLLSYGLKLFKKSENRGLHLWSTEISHLGKTCDHGIYRKWRDCWMWFLFASLDLWTIHWREKWSVSHITCRCQTSGAKLLETWVSKESICMLVKNTHYKSCPPKIQENEEYSL